MASKCCCKGRILHIAGRRAQMKGSERRLEPYGLGKFRAPHGAELAIDAFGVLACKCRLTRMY